MKQAGPEASSTLVVGEALVDCFVGHTVAGGAPFNVARSLAGLGQPVRFLTRIGADAHGELLLASARRFALDTSGFQRDHQRATGAVTVLEEAGQHRFQIHPNAAWDHINLVSARQVLQKTASPRVVYFGTLAQRSATSRQTVHSLLQHSAGLRFLDLNLRDGQDNRPLAEASLALADWVKLNDDELRQVLAWFAPNVASAAAAVPHLMQRFGLQRLIVTHGENGYSAWNQQGQRDIHGPAAAVPVVVDTVGAGDAFSAALLAQYSAAHARGEDFTARLPHALAVALALASRYAGAICAVRGALPENQGFFAAWRDALALQGQPSSSPASPDSPVESKPT